MISGLTQGSAEAVAAVLRIEDDPGLQHDLKVVIKQCAMLSVQQRIQQLANREPQPVGENQACLCRLELQWCRLRSQPDGEGEKPAA